MPSLSQRLASLIAPIGGLGFLVWMAAFPAESWLRKQGRPLLADTAAGYILGFSAALAWWVLTLIIKGHYSKFIPEQSVSKWISVFTLLVIFIFGAASFGASIFGNTNWQFNVGSAVGGFVMGACLGPLIEKVDGV